MTNGTGGGDCEGTLHLRRRSRLQVPPGDRSEQEVKLESERERESGNEREKEGLDFKCIQMGVKQGKS